MILRAIHIHYRKTGKYITVDNIIRGEKSHNPNNKHKEENQKTSEKYPPLRDKHC